MADFSTAVGSQLKYLVRSLTKQNFKAQCTEVDKLLSTFGLEATRFLLAFLVTGVRNANLLDPSHKDNLKLQLLSQIFARLPKETNFISLISDILEEHVPTRTGSGANQTKCEFLSQLCGTLHLPLLVQLSLGLGLCHSQNEETHKEGIQFMKNKLGEVTSNVVKTLPENVVHQLLHFIQTTDSFTEQERTLLNLDNLRHSLLSLCSLSASSRDHAGARRKRDQDLSKLSVDVADSLSLVGVMEEMGPVCVANSEEFGSLLELFPTLTASCVAQAVGMMASKPDATSLKQTPTSTPPAATSELYSSFLASLSEQSGIPSYSNGFVNGQPISTNWNTDVFVTAINEKYQIDWKEVLCKLDYPGFRLSNSNRSGLVVILGIYKKATNGQTASLNFLLDTWKNRVGQLSFLSHAVTAPPDYIDWRASEHVKTEGLPQSHSTSNCIWNSLSLIEMLLNLADNEHYGLARQVFDTPMKNFPDLLLVGLMQAKPKRSELQRELLRTLFPAYVQSKPQHSSVIIAHMWKMSPIMFTGALSVVYQENNDLLPTIVELSQEHKFMEGLLHHCTKASFLVAFVTTAATRNHLSVTEWTNHLYNATTKTSTFKHQVAKKLLVWCQAKIRAYEESGGHPAETHQLAVDIIGDIIKSIIEHGSKLPNQIAAKANMLYKDAKNTWPKLAQYCATQHCVFDPAIEEKANNQFGKIYTGQMTVEELISLMLTYKKSSNQQENEIYACMIHNLFDEYRFFPKYPEKELQVTAKLFGGIVACDGLSKIRLGIALRYILQAISRPANNKMQQFGIMALAAFQDRLPEWPQYCVHLKRIGGLVEMFRQCGQTPCVAILNPPGGSSPSTPVSGPLDGTDYSSATAFPAENTSGGSSLSSGTSGGLLPRQDSGTGLLPPHSLSPIVTAGSLPTPQPPTPTSTMSSIGTPTSNLSLSLGGPPGISSALKDNVFNWGNTGDISTLLRSSQQIPAPQDVIDKTGFLLNNLMEKNLDSTTSEFRKFIAPDHIAFLAQYLVIKRVSLEPNNHRLYLQWLERMYNKELDTHVLKNTHSAIKALLMSEKIRNSTSERSLLKNLGSWLGHQTIHRNRPVLRKDLPMKELILEALEKGKLIAVVPFVAKILERCAESKVFKPPNPWTMGLVSLLAEIHELPDLKLTLKFEVEVLCKNIGVIMGDTFKKLAENKARCMTEKLQDTRSRLDLTNSTDFMHRGDGVPITPTTGSSKGLGTPGMPSGIADFTTASSRAPAAAMMMHEEVVEPTPPTMVDSGSVKWSETAPSPMNNVYQGFIRQAGPTMGGLATQPAAAMLHTTFTPVNNSNFFNSVNNLPSIPQPAPEPPAPPPESAGEIRLRHPSLQEQVIMPTNIPLVKNQAKFVSLRPFIAAAIDRAIMEVINPVVERSVMIACTISTAFVMKDYINDTDEARIRCNATNMVKLVAANLAMVTCKDPLKLALARELRNTVSGKREVIGVDNNENVIGVSDYLVKENLDLAVKLVKQSASEQASMEISSTLDPALEERRKAQEAGQPYWPSINGENIWTQAKPFLASLPEQLHPPTQLMTHHQRVYDEFAQLLSPSPEEGDTTITQLTSLQHTLKSIEEEATVHYKNNPPNSNTASILSLTHSSFTQHSQSPQHERIKELVCGIHPLIKVGTALVFARNIIDKVFSLSERILAEQRAQPTVELYVMMLVNEVCLFVLQTAREKNSPTVTAELTKLFLSHDKRWAHKYIAVNFIRLRLINMDDFDKHLASALEDYVAQGGYARGANGRVVEFAGSIVQRCLIDEPLVNRGELSRTLQVLGELAKTDSGGSPLQQQAAALAAINVNAPATKQPQIQPPTGQLTGTGPLLGGGATANPASIAPSPVSVTPTPAVTLAGLTVPPPVQSPATGGTVTTPTSIPTPSTAISTTSQATTGTPVTNASGSPPLESDMRKTVTKLFQEWIAICSGKFQSPEGHSTPQQQAMAFIGKLQQHGMLKAVQVMDKFFALLMEMSVEYHVTESQKQKQAEESSQTEEGRKKNRDKEDGASVFLTVDAFSDLIVLLIKCCGRGQQQQPKQSEREGSNIAAEVALLTKVLHVVSRVLIEDHDKQFNSLLNKSANYQGFHQQPYFRFFSNLLIALNSNAQSDGENAPSSEILTVFSNTFHALSPLRLPGFAFSWLELVPHRMFMPKLLLTKHQDGWPHFQRLLVDCLKFLEPSLRNAELNEAIRLFYKGTLKILLVLLHDFPEFLCSYHFNFCDVIPPSCIQLRNVILSSFPRHMRLPDPFTPNLKVDLLPEIAQPPRILSKYSDILKPTPSSNGGPATPPLVSMEEIENYMKNRTPTDWVNTLPAKLLLPPQQSTQAGYRYNIPLINSLVLTVGTMAIAQINQTTGELTQAAAAILDSPAMDIYHSLLTSLDSEGRYLFINALSNHLRYPNNHTHYFSCVVLHLFAEAKTTQREVIQEQMTRVLLERLIVNRPHPWGLLITFIELVKNPRYNFWGKPFIHCTPEIERLFENVGQSCVGNVPRTSQGQ